VCLIARYFESRGLPTLILGSALDILSAGQPPRGVFLNYPLGFEAGKPFDPENQLSVVRQALATFEQTSPGIQTLDYEWAEGWEMIAARSAASGGGDFRSPRDTTPRYQTEADRLLAEGANK